MAAEKKGIKETKEVLVGALALGLFVRNRLKDGADLGDASALGQKLLLDEKFGQLMKDAAKDIDQVDDEIKDISWSEGTELVSAVTAAYNEHKDAA